MTNTQLARRLAVAIDWYQHFTKAGNAQAAANELEIACKYAADLLNSDEEVAA